MDIKAPTNFICYWRISIIANKRKKMKQFIFHIRYKQISIIGGFPLLLAPL